MKKKLEQFLCFLSDVVAERLRRPLEALQAQMAKQEETLCRKMEEQSREMQRELKAHRGDLDALVRWKDQQQAMETVALECDLAILDDRICSQIAQCRRKGYTTEEERRRVNRMHKAYQMRGGNHGEENEYRLFCSLPTEEAFGGRT